MITSCLAACAMAVLFLVASATGLERAAIDRLLELARSQPGSPAFREAVVKGLGEAEIKNGEAFNSNGPDFLFAVETAKQPTLILDDNTGGPDAAQWRNRPVVLHGTTAGGDLASFSLPH